MTLDFHWKSPAHPKKEVPILENTDGPNCIERNFLQKSKFDRPKSDLFETFCTGFKTLETELGNSTYTYFHIHLLQALVQI